MKVINFHEISDQDWFYSAIRMIRKKYSIVPFSALQDFYAGKNHGKNQVHITVDDGHKSTYSIIYSHLHSLDLSFSIFVSPKIINEEKNFWFEEISDYDDTLLKSCIARELNILPNELNDFYSHSILKQIKLSRIWKIIKDYQSLTGVHPKEFQYINKDQLLEMHASGKVHIGAHTQTHPILANETDADAEWQIGDSVHELSKMLNTEIISFAYPNGSPGLDFGEREKSILKSLNIPYAFSYKMRSCKRSDNLLEIPRLGLYHGTESFMRKKIEWGFFWEPLKEKFFHTEDKHRKKIQQFFDMQNISL